MTSGNPASNFGLGPKSCRTCSPMSIALRPQRPHFKIEMAGQLVHPDKIQTAARKIWLIDSKYAVNCRWFWREINQPINQSSQMPPAPTPIQATVRSPNRRDIQKAVRCHAAVQFNLNQGDWSDFNCKFIYDDVKISTLNCKQRNETTTDGALMISLKLSMKCSCCTNSGKKGATKTLSPHMSLIKSVSI